MAKRSQIRRIKIHRTYTIAEAADVVGRHKHTVSRWIAAGLPTTDSKRPLLIHGADLRAFLREREPMKQPCRPGEFFCFTCRARKRPALDMVEYLPRTSSRGLLRGICPTCERLIYRAASLASIEQMRSGLDITFPKAERRLDDSASAFSDVDFKEACET